MIDSHDTDLAHPAAEAFIDKWRGVTASELSTSQSFLIDLCHLLGVETPHPTPEQDYMFERPISFRHGDGSSSAGRIDLYRRGAFVLESKKLKAGAHTRGFDEAMLRARSQAENYARALPAGEGRPPFVVVVDVGHRIELYSEFSRSGGTYTPFPDPRHHRIALDDLLDPDIRERLRQVWLDPLNLDPSRESARVTRDIASRLVGLALLFDKGSTAPAHPIATGVIKPKVGYGEGDAHNALADIRALELLASAGALGGPPVALCTSDLAMARLWQALRVKRVGRVDDKFVGEVCLSSSLFPLLDDVGRGTLRRMIEQHC